MATIIKGSTKRGQELINRAHYNEGRDLHQVYGTVSSAKTRAYEDCLRWYLESINHDNFRIISHNTFQFSVAWECDWEYTDPKTGEVTIEPATRIETANSTYVVIHNK